MENTSIQLTATKNQIKLLSSKIAATPLSICSNGSAADHNINPCMCVHYTVAKPCNFNITDHSNTNSNYYDWCPSSNDMLHAWLWNLRCPNLDNTSQSSKRFDTCIIIIPLGILCY